MLRARRACLAAARAARSTIRSITIPLSRPRNVRVNLGTTLVRPKRPTGRSLVVPALQGLATGIAFGLAAGAHAIPSAVAVLALGGLALVYALLSFGLEKP